MAETRDQTISDVSQTLLNLLTESLDGVKVELKSPKEPDADTHLTLFLYKVLENAYLRNAEEVPQTINVNGTLIQNSPPLTVDLYYILTAHSAQLGAIEAHRALSRAMRVFYDHGVLRGSLLRTLDAERGLAADTVLRITLNPISVEDMTRLWSVFPDTPYEISVTYLVTPVEIQSARTLETAPVVDQHLEQGHRGAEVTP